MAMPYSKMHAVTRFQAGCDEVTRLPGLSFVDAHDPVAEVVVLAEDVGVEVMGLVVGALPLRRRGDVVPLPGRRVDLRVPHPVPLAVQHVVADLHVVQDLGQTQRRGADPPRGSSPAGQQHHATAELECPLHLDHSPDVGGVARPATLQHVLPDRLELAAHRLDIRVTQPDRGNRAWNLGLDWSGAHVGPSDWSKRRRRGPGWPVQLRLLRYKGECTNGRNLVTQSSLSSSHPSRPRVLVIEAGGSLTRVSAAQQPLEVDVDARRRTRRRSRSRNSTPAQLHHPDHLLGEDAVPDRRRVHAVEGEQAAVGAAVRPGAEEPRGRDRVEALQRGRQLVRRPPVRPRPRAVDVAPRREPVEDPAHVEQVPVEAVAAGGLHRRDDRLVVGVDRGVDRAHLVLGEVRVALAGRSRRR